MNDRRRLVLKATLAAGSAGLLVGAGLLSPSVVLAAGREGFQATTADEAIREAMGMNRPADDARVVIEAQELAENGAVVPVTVHTELPGVTEIAILVAHNINPLTSRYRLGTGTRAFVSTRLKLMESSEVIAVVKANGQIHGNSRLIRVTIGGCG